MWEGACFHGITHAPIPRVPAFPIFGVCRSSTGTEIRRKMSPLHMPTWHDHTAWAYAGGAFSGTSTKLHMVSIDQIG